MNKTSSPNSTTKWPQIAVRWSPSGAPADRFARFKEGLRRLVRRLPPTPRGLLLAALCGLAFWFWGWRQTDLLVLVFSVVGLVLFVASQLLAEIVAWRCRRALRHCQSELGRLEAGSPLTTGFSLPSFARWPLIQLDWRWDEPAGVECRLRDRDGRLHEQVVARRRGEAQEIVRRLVVESSFGLARVEWRQPETKSILILPEIGALKALPVIRSLASGDALAHPVGAPEGDRMEIRRYAPGDPVKHILWKTFARTRQLNVRTPERAVDRSRRTLAYLLAGGEDEAAAAVTRVALTRRLLGEKWLFGADGSDEVTEELEPALRLIARSAGHRPAPALDGLQRFVRRPDVAGEAHGVVFAPAEAGPWLDDLLAAIPRMRLGITLVFGTDGVQLREESPWWRRFLLRPAPAGAATTSEALQALLRRCQNARCPALVVDRRSGRVFDAQNALPMGLRAAS